MSDAQAAYRGWAVVEMFGHQQEIGLVSTEYFGAAAMFRIDVPEFDAQQARTRYVSPGAIYALNPCTEEVARNMLARRYVPAQRLALPASAPSSDESEEYF